jgi:hypothetical protein
MPATTTSLAAQHSSHVCSGIFVSYWVDYGVLKSISSQSSMQWQIPIGLQIVPAALLGLGMLTLKESTRWLTQKDRHEEAWESLKWVRASDSEEVAAEMEEIRTGVEIEARATEGFQAKGTTAATPIMSLHTS